MSDNATHELRGMYPPNESMVIVRMSLELNLPGSLPYYVNGMELKVDRYMYERLREDPKVLDGWLHQQVVNHVLANSRTHSVFIDTTRYQR